MAELQREGQLISGFAHALGGGVAAVVQQQDDRDLGEVHVDLADQRAEAGGDALLLVFDRNRHDNARNARSRRSEAFDTGGEVHAGSGGHLPGRPGV